MLKHVIIQKDGILIKDFSYMKFMQCFNEKYGGTKFTPTYELEKMIKDYDISFEASWIIIYTFFVPEFYEIFYKLGTDYKDRTFLDIADELYNGTWLCKNDSANISIDLSPLNLFVIKPKDFQLDFIKEYPKLKYKYDLDGYILSFDQGLGKTFTAIALAECLYKNLVYIVCPNSIKEEWAKEIRSYYKKYINNEKLWKSEVFVSGIGGYTYNKDTTKFIIVNQESIPNIFSYIDVKKNSRIIIDECQNFRGLNTKRVSEMLKLKELSMSKDILMMSGTPIKALASELSPALLMVDPHFTKEAAIKFDDIFSNRKTDLMSIASMRFKRVIYRKLKKDTSLKLPEKTIEIYHATIPNPERFCTPAFRDKIAELYHKEYIKRLKSGLFTYNKKNQYYRSSAGSYDFEKEKADFSNIIYKYTNVSKIVTDDYLNYIFQSGKDMHVLTKVRYRNIEDSYDTFIKLYMNKIKEPKDKEVLKRFDGFIGWKIAAKSAYMSAFGKIYAKMQNQCFEEIWKFNSQDIIDKIEKNKKKTIIFTFFSPTADFIYNNLKEKGIPALKISGETSKRGDVINTFKIDDSIRVLVATIQTIGTGVTLTEANQRFFFGTPWRDADYQQAIDRIHRIGQDSPVHIYNVILKSIQPNITQRMQEVMEWSADMTKQIMTEEIEL